MHGLGFEQCFLMSVYLQLRRTLSFGIDNEGGNAAKHGTVCSAYFLTLRMC